ncbi:MAG: ATPase, T2SS/T4P/T4SS family [Candidatus Omnitrophota bacterium]|jgi:type IV pilus assembly protein PilB
MRTTSNKRVYQILRDSGAVSEEDLKKTLKTAETSGKDFLSLILDGGFLEERALLDIFSKATGCPVVSLKTLTPDSVVFDHVPVKFASYYRFFPIRVEKGKLLIATSRIFDINTLDEMRFAMGYEIEICFAPEREIQEMLRRHYGLAADTVEKILSEASPQDHPLPVSEVPEVEDIEKLAQAPSVAHVVNQIILDAYKKRASDIHLEPLQSGIRIRYRIDGILQEAPVPRELKDFFAPMLSRIKIMANLNVAEKRLPQDGKFRVKTQEETLDLRVSFIPTANGESVVIRILPGKNVFRLEQLGFEQKHQKILEELLSRHNGILFVTGPTGSGKSTTLYASLNKLNSPDRKIITIEDPVEYELEGVNQIHVNPDIGLSFANGLRSMLRQDPDVMMVGEVRDLETADIAIRAALTGHLILSTLHTNDAASGVTRLLDIGVAPYLIASSVVAFVAQRLVRVICPVCKAEVPYIKEEVKNLIEREYGIRETDIRIFRGKGCEQCGHTGFRGRLAIHEVLRLTEPIRKLIMDRATAESIKTEAIRQGMTTLRFNGWEKVMLGLTTVEEVLETTEDDRLEGWTAESKDTVPEVIRIAEEKSGVGSLPSVEPQADSDNKFTNLRKFQRLSCEVPVFFKIVDYKGEDARIIQAKKELMQVEFEGVSRDLSAGGIYFSVLDQPITDKIGAIEGPAILLWESLEVGSVLDIRILLPKGEKPVRCMAKICRVFRSMGQASSGVTAWCRIGLSFLALDSDDRHRLMKFSKINAESNEPV